MPFSSVPLGLVDAPRKFEEGNVLQGKADRAAERVRRASAQAESDRKYEEIWARLDKMGTLPGMPKIPQAGELVSGASTPAVAPSENDPARDMAPMGKSPQLTARDVAGDPIPAEFRRDGVGGPEQEQPPQDELAQIEAELARRELAAIEAELARRGQGQSEPTGSIDDAINESVKQIPGGYKNWLEQNQPAPEGQRYELDPLSKSGKYNLVPDDPAARQKQTQDMAWGGDIQDTPDGQWNEQLADILSGGVEGIMDVFKGQKDTANDPVGTAANTFVKPMLDLPSSALRDPGGTALAISPFHQAARAYGAANSALIDATEGDFEGAKNNAGTALMEGSNAVLSVAGAGLVKPKGPRSALDAASAATKKPLVREPSVREAGKALAATAVPNRPIRPQAMRAIEKILVNGGVPRDRIASGLTEVVQLLQGSVDGGGQSARPLTVGAALKKVFGDEFPEVRQNIDTVRLERRLTRKRGDSSPATVRETVQDMRGSQVPFLTESATKNMGATTRNATRKDMEAQLSEFGEEGYTPIISQPIDAARTKRIQDVLNGPGMAELGKPLRQIAAGEGKTIEAMMQESPLAAAHWMQHKARLLAEENGGTTLGNAYASMRNRILATLDDLKTPEGQTYKDLRTQYAETAKIGTDLKAGDQFGAIVRNPEKATAFVEKFEAATPAQQEAQLASIGDWVLSKLRGGGEEAAARMTDIQNIAVLETLDRLGAKGKALADDIRAIRDEEADLARFYPKSESQTITNSVALKEGPDIYSKQGGAGASASALADAGLMTAGASQLPVLSLLNKGVDAVREMRRPRRATREDMTKVLMSRPGKGARTSALVEPPTTPKPPTQSPPEAPSISKNITLATAKTDDGKGVTVKGQAFNDRGRMVLSPEWPTNVFDELAGAQQKRAEDLLYPQRPTPTLVDENYGKPPKARPEWEVENPKAAAEIDKQVAERFVGLMNADQSPVHVLALKEGVGIQAIGDIIESGLPQNKQIFIAKDGGEIVVVDKAWHRQNPDEYTAERWSRMWPGSVTREGRRYGWKDGRPFIFVESAPKPSK